MKLPMFIVCSLAVFINILLKRGVCVAINDGFLIAHRELRLRHAVMDYFADYARPRFGKANINCYWLSKSYYDLYPTVSDIPYRLYVYANFAIHCIKTKRYLSF